MKNFLLLFSVISVGAAIWLGPQFSILFLIDRALSILNWLDGVENFNTRNPNYVEGNWAPIHTELNGVTVKGQGKLPENLLQGMYVRNGANPKCWPPADRVKNHAFGGEAMLQRYISITLQMQKYYKTVR